MTPKNGTQSQDGNTPDKDTRRAKYAVLWQEDMKAIRRPRGYKALARTTKWNVNTVKSDIRRMDKEAQETAKETLTPAPPEIHPPMDGFGNGPVASPPLVVAPPRVPAERVSMDWDGDLVKVARIVTAAFSQTLRGELVCECGRKHPMVNDPALALRLASAFSRMYTAKMGGDRVSVFMALNQPPPPVKELDIRDVIATLQRHDVGPECILCGALRCRGHGSVIDMDIEEGENEK